MKIVIITMSYTYLIEITPQLRNIVPKVANLIEHMEYINSNWSLVEH